MHADDVLALCHTREQGEQVKARLADWLAPKGLVFNEDKTQITPLKRAYFLEFAIAGTPSASCYQAEQRGAATNPAAIAHRGQGPAWGQRRRGHRQAQPIITGWAAYYTGSGWSNAPSTRWTHTCGGSSTIWASLTHLNKPQRWVIARYFGMFNPARRDKWVFGSRDRRFYLRKFAWAPIIRHRMVDRTASPDDPSLADYWYRQGRRQRPPLGTATLQLLRAQHGRCPLLPGLLLHADREPQSPARLGTMVLGHT